MHSVQCTVRCEHCTVHCVQCTVHCFQCTVHCVQCTVHYVQCSVHCVQCQPLNNFFAECLLLISRDYAALKCVFIFLEGNAKITECSCGLYKLLFSPFRLMVYRERPNSK